MQKQTGKDGTWGGHVYQGRFKSFAVETNEYLLTVCRYVDRNPWRVGLVARAKQWRWSSAWQCGSECGVVSMNDRPITRPADRVHGVHQGERQEQIAVVRRTVLNG